MTGHAPVSALHGLALLAASVSRLDVTLSSLDDATVAGPSALPGWNRAMLLTHLARNADAFRRVALGAASGDSVDMYPGGPDGRQADIDAGRDRPAAAVVKDVRSSEGALRDALGALPAAGWDGWGRSPRAPLPVAQIPATRRMEVEVHHVDLELGYAPRDWPADFVAAGLDVASDGLERRIAGGTALRLEAADGSFSATFGGGDEVLVRADGHELLAWLLGRAGGPPGAPALGAWR